MDQEHPGGFPSTLWKTQKKKSLPHHLPKNNQGERDLTKEVLTSGARRTPKYGIIYVVFMETISQSHCWYLGHWLETSFCVNTIEKNKEIIQE